MTDAALAGTPRFSRLDRRKARTRQALVDAAVQLIAQGRGDRASIQEITDAAEIGFGSFYFDGQDQLFATASGGGDGTLGPDDRPSLRGHRRPGRGICRVPPPGSVTINAVSRQGCLRLSRFAVAQAGAPIPFGLREGRIRAGARRLLDIIPGTC